MKTKDEQQMEYIQMHQEMEALKFIQSISWVSPDWKLVGLRYYEISKKKLSNLKSA